jgi:F0F1-type ATP synthase gamma subunit
MAKLQQLENQLHDLEMLGRVVQAYENISSLQIRQIRDRVLQAREYFHELWAMYDQLRIDVPIKPTKHDNKTGSCAVLISSDLSFASGLDEEIIQTMLEGISSSSTDIVALGSRGAELLRSRNIEVAKMFHLPTIEAKINIVSLMNYLDSYSKVTLYFARFESVTQQAVVSFELHDSVARLEVRQQSESNDELLYASDFLFEPSLDDVIEYLEKTMSSIALTQIILETNLSQLAYRYNSLSQARSAANKQLQQGSIALSTYKRRRRDVESLAYQPIGELL